MKKQLADANAKIEKFKSQERDDEDCHHKKPRTDSSLSSRIAPQATDSSLSERIALPATGAVYPEPSYHMAHGVPVPHNEEDIFHDDDDAAHLSFFETPQ
jgi:hypothetical protein